MIIKKKDLHVEQVPNPDPTDPRPWWKVILRLPQLSMETTLLNTPDYANDLINMILQKDSNCPHCGKKLDDKKSKH